MEISLGFIAKTVEFCYKIVASAGSSVDFAFALGGVFLRWWWWSPAGISSSGARRPTPAGGGRPSTPLPPHPLKLSSSLLPTVLSHPRATSPRRSQRQALQGPPRRYAVQPRRPLPGRLGPLVRAVPRQPGPDRRPGRAAAGHRTADPAIARLSRYRSILPHPATDILRLAKGAS